ncbi:hypothetical protein [Streptomyces sp. NPDC002758]
MHDIQNEPAGRGIAIDKVEPPCTAWPVADRYDADGLALIILRTAPPRRR